MQVKIQAVYDYLKGLTKKQKYFLYIAISLVSLAFFDRVILSPIISRVSSLNQEIKEKKRNIHRNLRILSYKDSILSETAKYTSFLKPGEGAEEGITVMLKEVESLANEESIYLLDMKPRRSVTKVDSFNEYSIDLTGEAQMDQVMDFMYNIENSSDLLTIDRYEISPKSRNSSVARFSMTISKLVLEN